MRDKSSKLHYYKVFQGAISGFIAHEHMDAIKTRRLYIDHITKTKRFNMFPKLPQNIHLRKKYKSE